MSQYYNSKRTKNLFDPKSDKPFKLSRSKIDLFLECPRCFYLDRKLGVSRPAGFPFNLNSAVDHLLKKEFDLHRRGATRHPLMETYGIDALPFQHQKIEEWRDNFTGIQFLHTPTNLLITGAIDDVWINPRGELHIVDYKATSKETEINLDAEWQDGYKRQVEVYQWLFRRNNFKVSDTAYFVYANGMRDRRAFDGKLEFDVTVIPYKGSDKWIDGTLEKIKEMLGSEKLPPANPQCDYCSYRKSAMEMLEQYMSEVKKIKKEKDDEKPTATLF